MELKELISDLKRQLADAEMEAAKSGDAMLSLSTVDVELAVKFTKEGKAGVRAWVVELGGAAKKEDSHTITLSFSLTEEMVMALGDKRPAGSGPIYSD